MYASDAALVAFPRDAADVAAAIRAAARARLLVLTRGAGTSLAGQAVGERGSCSHLAPHGRDRGDRRGRADRGVGPGVVQDDLNRTARRTGSRSGPDTSTSNRRRSAA